MQQIKTQITIKKALLSVSFLILSFTASNACQVNATWQLELPNYINLELRILAIPPEGTINEPRRAPIRRPTIGYDGNTLYLYGQFGDLTLQLLNNGAEEYTTVVPAGANEVALPNYTPGIYELQMNDGRYIYTCEIEIE